MLIKYLITLCLLWPILVFGYEKDKDYLALPDNPSMQALQNKHQVVITEFFSYGCPACFKLEPHLENWLKTKPKNIIFERIPVVFEPGWDVYAKTYLVLNKLNKSEKLSPEIFMAIHLDNLDLSTKEAMAAFLHTKGIDKNTFLSLYDSPDIDMALSKDKKIVTDYKVFQVPGIVINGKYKVDPSLSGANYDKLFDIVNNLMRSTPKAVGVQKGGQTHTG